MGMQALKNKFKEVTGEDWGGAAPQESSKKKKVGHTGPRPRQAPDSQVSSETVVWPLVWADLACP